MTALLVRRLYQLGYTNSEFARLAGCTRQRVGAVVQGVDAIGVRVADRWAELLHCHFEVTLVADDPDNERSRLT